jgi:hypothetical protein
LACRLPDKRRTVAFSSADVQDVLYAMNTMQPKDASNAFKAALQAFGVTWERKTKSAEKVPA